MLQLIKHQNLEKFLGKIIAVKTNNFAINRQKSALNIFGSDFYCMKLDDFFDRHDEFLRCRDKFLNYPDRSGYKCRFIYLTNEKYIPSMHIFSDEMLEKTQYFVRELTNEEKLSLSELLEQKLINLEYYADDSFHYDKIKQCIEDS